jgi:hypothetical protein
MLPADLEYQNLLTILDPYIAKGHTVSRAFLKWILESIFRLDDTTSSDAICDDNYDKGIDGIYVDVLLEEIQVFQSRLGQSPGKTLGDVALKEFAGSLVQVSSPAHIAAMLNSPPVSPQLANLISRTKVKEYLRSGFSVVGVFVTNLTKDTNGEAYLQHRDDLRVFDAPAIAAEYIEIDKPQGVRGVAVLDTFGVQPLVFPTVANAKLVVMPARASDLIKMGGIHDGEIFSQNVRLDLGRTKVNRDIEKSITDQSEHKYFPLYHNGITILSERVEYANDKVELENYTVVNGAQSLSALNRRKSSVSSDLRLLVKIIEISSNSELARKITHNSNNQNAIKPRDLKSNSVYQLRLQKEVASVPPGIFGLSIKGGEKISQSIVIDNEVAGKALLSFDLQEPWSSHQGYRIFDDLFDRIFSRGEVTGERMVMLHCTLECIDQKLGKLDNKLFANYAMTRYFLLYLVSRVLQRDPLGRLIYKSASEVFKNKDGLNAFRSAISNLLSDIFVDLNAEVNSLGEEFDYKNALKSVTQARKLGDDVLAAYWKLVDRGRIGSFESDYSAELNSRSAT